ncbi:hypothetical protein GJ496_008384 [Pomphorhynchus laevis]|nr:hypothetical protein GJ496_008384 [Pomphorhynchus laevis]
MIVEDVHSDTAESDVDTRKSKGVLTIGDIQRIRIERLMSQPEKPAHIPETRQSKMPRAFEPHEFVRNVMGASAGAGSGEFDIYRGCRRRQRIRQDYMYYQEKQKIANDEWQRRIQQRNDHSEEKTAKKRAKRLKQKIKKKLKLQQESKEVDVQKNDDSKQQID